MCKIIPTVKTHWHVKLLNKRHFTDRNKPTPDESHSIIVNNIMSGERIYKYK